MSGCGFRVENGTEISGHTVGDAFEVEFVVEGCLGAGGGGVDWASSANTRRIASLEPGEEKGSR